MIVERLGLILIGNILFILKFRTPIIYEFLVPSLMLGILNESLKLVSLGRNFYFHHSTKKKNKPKRLV